MSRVRPLVRDDLEQVVDLHRRSFATGSPPEELRRFLEDIFCDHPWRDDEVPSLVHEDGGGRVTGCIGAMARPMWIGERPVRAAVSHNFMVDAGHRRALAAIALMREFLSGPQDLTLADGNEASRKLWEKCGGSSLLSHSFRWLRVLRPVQGVLHLLEKRGTPRALVAAPSWLARLPDGAAMRLPGSPFRVEVPSLTRVEVDARRLVELICGHSRGARLRPRYDEASMTWLLSMLARTSRRQALRCVAAAREDGGVEGWYVYYRRVGGISRVLQLAARPHARDEVLRCLLRDAREERAVAVTGQVEPAWVDTLRRASCFFDHSGHWILARSSLPEVRDALHSGAFFLSRLEGESWMRFAS